MFYKSENIRPFLKKLSHKRQKFLQKEYTSSQSSCYNHFGDRYSVKGCVMHMVSVQALCNTIIKKSFDENISVSPMKLQKLMYFIYRDYLQKTNEPLFIEEFQAWQYGPVLQSVYDEFKTFKANRITRFAKTANNEVYIINESLDPILSLVINSVWNQYKNLDGITLSQITHKDGGAWRKAFEKNKLTIEIEDIKGDHVC